MKSGHETVEAGDRRVVVVGSGPAGAAAAHALVRAGIPVVMLESGQTLPRGYLIRIAGRNIAHWTSEQGVENGSKHLSTGDPKTDWWSNHSPGGLSNQWTGAVPRFAPQDFTEGERLHERYRWPVTYADLAPHYERAERLMEITASGEDVPLLPAGFASHRARLPRDWREVAEVAAKHGQGMTVMPLADGPPNLLARRGTAFNSYHSVVRPLLRSPLFRLVRGAHALQLEWNGAKRRVTGIVYHDRTDGSQKRIEAAGVIVACGALDSTRLLFQSACADFPQGLGNTEGILGRFLHDHPREWWVVDLDRQVEVPWPAVYLTRVPPQDSPPLLASSWTLGVVSQRDKIGGLFGRKSSSISAQVFGTMVPRESTLVEPDPDQKDPLGLPRLRIHIAFDTDTVCNMTRAKERLLGLLEEAGYSGRIRPFEDHLWPGSSVHYGGTVRMHDSPRYGVLDSWNRIYGVPNVVVGDSSCFTTGAEKNPTLTAMALAIRAAERFAHDLKTG